MQTKVIFKSRPVYINKRNTVPASEIVEVYDREVSQSDLSLRAKAMNWDLVSIEVI